jgi:hypothetical protein
MACTRRAVDPGDCKKNRTFPTHHAEHARVFSRDHSSPGKTSYDWRHYLAVVQRKPGALRNGAPFMTLPRSFQRLQTLLLKQPGGDRQMADILSLVLHHDEPLVEQAVREALHSGVPTKTHVLNCLGRLLDTPRPAPLRTPPALAISDEPIANTERYDYLRKAAWPTDSCTWTSLSWMNWAICRSARPAAHYCSI